MKRAILLALVALISSGSHAVAATVLRFDPAAAGSGERVTGKTVGSGMQGIESGRAIVLLAHSDRAADRATGPSDPRLVRFGVMTADENDVGYFVGTVPAVEAGSYIAVAYCRRCVQGGSVFTVGKFEVTGAVLPLTGSHHYLWIVMGMTLIVVGTAFARGQVRSRSSALAMRPDCELSGQVGRRVL